MRNLLLSAFCLCFCLFPKVNFAYYPPNLGAAANFILFTPIGAISNTGTSTISGNIGNNVGAISGFGAPTVFNGVIHHADVNTWQAVYDISSALGQLNTQAATAAMPASIGAGQTITTGVYSFVGACNITANLILDGGGDTNAVFIFQVNGALTTDAGSTVTLMNGASASNIFWAVNGAASMGAISGFYGTIISKGAIGIGAGSSFTGRALTTTGAVSGNSFTGNIPNGPSITTTQPDCSGTVGAITINAPTGAGYAYSIGALFQSAPSFAGLAPGTYPISVKNNAGLLISSGISVVINAQYQTANPYSLASAGKFVLFTSSGAVSNTSTSDIASGDIGTNVGAISGMGSPSMVNGASHSADAVTAQAKTDLAAAYTTLQSQTATGAFPAAPVDGQVFTAGIYSIAGASAINGKLILDAAGNSNAVFVFQIGGAFTSGAGAAIILLNGANASRVFWVVNGAAAFAANTTMIGNVINNAAISFGDGSILVGRALSTVGAVSIYGTLVNAPFQCYSSTQVLPVTFGQIAAIAQNCAVDVSFQVLSQQNNKQFEVENATTLNGNWTTLAIIAGDGQSSTAKTYNYIHTAAAIGNNYYRIKQIDLDGKATYSAIASALNNCSNNAIVSYPNPIKNKLSVLLPTGINKSTIRIINSVGQIVYSQPGHAAENIIYTNSFTAGVYIIQVVNNNEIIYKHTIIKD